MKRILKIFSTILFLFMIFGCSNEDIKISFKKIGNLKPKSPVYFESDSVGFVKRIDFLDSNYLVHIKITDNKELLNYNPYFYLVDLNSKTKIVIINDPSKGLKRFEGDSIFKGGDEIDYYIKLFSLKIQGKIDSLKTDEKFKDIIDNLNLKLEELKEKSKEEYEKLKPELEKNLDEIFEKLRKSFSSEEFESLKYHLKKLF